MGKIIDMRALDNFLEMIGTSREILQFSIANYQKMRGKKPLNIVIPHPKITIFGVNLCFSNSDELDRKLMNESNQTILLGIATDSDEYTKH